MIWQRSVVAKEKVRTIEVNDYGCKNSFKSSYKQPSNICTEGGAFRELQSRSQLPTEEYI